MSDDGKRYVIGLGTGRSGTVSLTRLLNAQTAANVTHELKPLLPWVYDERAIAQLIETLTQRNGELVGDVAFFYLPYVRKIIDGLANVRFVCMRRGREAFIASMMKKTGTDNHWVDHDGSRWTLNADWDRTMPSYEPMEKKVAVGRYWDEYYQEAEALRSEFSESFEIFELEDSFGSEEGVKRILDHVGIAPSRQSLVLDIQENVGTGERDGIARLYEEQSRLRAGIRSRDERVEELESAVRSRDERVEELESAVRSRDERVEELESAVRSRDRRIRELDAAVAGRDIKVLTLERTVATLRGETSKLVQLDKQISAKRERVAELKERFRA